MYSNDDDRLSFDLFTPSQGQICIAIDLYGGKSFFFQYVFKTNG